MSCVSLSDPTCRDGNVQFTSISLKALPDQVLINNINVYNIEKSGFPTKVTYAFLLRESIKEVSIVKHIKVIMCFTLLIR